VRICNEERVMLILTRRLTEVLCLGPDITVTVLSIKSNKVKIGVDAPRSVSVDRQEVRQRKRRSTVANPSRTIDPAGRAEPTDRTLELAD
jgi:carbon storage regulator CsrA